MLLQLRALFEETAVAAVGWPGHYAPHLKDVHPPGRPADALLCTSLQDNPEVTKVSDMARHAGEAWRAIQPDKRAEYEKMSADNKVPRLLLRPALATHTLRPKRTSTTTHKRQVPFR